MAQPVTSDSRAVSNYPNNRWLLSASGYLGLGRCWCPSVIRVTSNLTLLTTVAYGHCAWTSSGMHFSPETLCSRCAAAFPRMTSVGVTALYHSHEAGTLMMPQHTHQTTRLRTPFHSTRADPLSHVLDLFQPASAVSRTPGLCRPPSYQVQFALRYRAIENQVQPEPDFQRSHHRDSHPRRSLDQPTLGLPVTTRSPREQTVRASSAGVLPNSQASICAACSYPPPSPKPQGPGPASCCPRRLNNIAAALNTPLMPHDTTRYTTGP
jgi:hypothetical protein